MRKKGNNVNTTGDLDLFGDSIEQVTPEEEVKEVKVKKERKPFNKKKFMKVTGSLVGLSLVGGLVWAYFTPGGYILEGSNLEALKTYESSMKSWATTDSDGKTLIKGSGVLGKYMEDEFLYANGNQYKLDFLNTVLKTVTYTPGTITGKNKLGMEVSGSLTSTVSDGEAVSLTYIDYLAVADYVLEDSRVVSKYLEEHGIDDSTTDRRNRIVDAFCDYFVNEVPVEDMLTTDAQYVPSVVGGVVSEAEDIAINNLLYDSDEFEYLLEVFSLVSSGGFGESKLYTEDYSNLLESELGLSTPVEGTLSDEDSDETEVVAPSPLTREDYVIFDTLADMEEAVEMGTFSKTYTVDEETTTEETDEEGNTVEVSNTEEVEKETDYLIKYDNTKLLMNLRWCGAYDLQNGDKSDIVPIELGDGTFANPAAIGTWVTTKALATDGTLVDVKVRLVDYKVSDDALTFFSTLSEKNRGFSLKSKVQYAYYKLEVYNLSKKTVNLEELGMLCDKDSNMSPKTGTVFNLESEGSASSESTITLEGWCNSNELYSKYLTWGKGFNREADLVWFRVLAGDIENTDIYKGVYVVE